MATATVRMLAAAAATLMLAASVLRSDAQPSYPSRSVRVVVSFPAGSATDIIARLLADRLTQKWNVPVVVENVPGAAGQIGTGRVVRSAPDGYTLIVSPPAQLVTHAALYKSLTYDPAQLMPVALLAQVPYGLTVRKNPALATIKDFIAFAKANPGKLSYASQGVGSTSHLTTKLFEKLAGIQMLHVPYRGRHLHSRISLPATSTRCSTTSGTRCHFLSATTYKSSQSPTMTASARYRMSRHCTRRDFQASGR